MPWKETCVVDVRREFVLRALSEGACFDELCREYGISRRTGYKWKKRFLDQGQAGLEDVSRRPRSSPSQLSEDVLLEIVRIKNAHPSWGPRKIRDVYANAHLGTEVPSESSFKRVLEKAGLVTKRRRRASHEGGRLEQRVAAEKPNDVWTVDFKGWWYTHRHERCEPLTVRDAYSRFVLCATPLENAKGITVRQEFERLFETYGLPKVIRSDNGSPFACTSAPLGLTKLSAWWIANGIGLDRIPPGRPDQNGGHERMHRDIAMEVERTPETDLIAQRAALETWRHTFNYERPHEALGMRRPGELYQKSERKWNGQTDELTYPEGLFRRKVPRNGMIGIDGIKIGISMALSGWHVGLKPCPEDQFLVWFGALCLGTVDLRTQSFKVHENDAN